MKSYIGTKLINAIPMTRLAYNEFRGWTLPADERGEDEGYLVEYLDGGKPNTAQYEGYVSWSPKGQFDNAYREIIGLSFGLALEAIGKGHKVARSGWNGKGMFIYYVPENVYPANGNKLNTMAGIFPDDLVPYRAYIAMKTAQGDVVPWVASQSDILAEDWAIANNGLKIGDHVISIAGAASVGVSGAVEVIRSEMSVGVRTVDGGDLWHEEAKHWKKVA